MSATGISRPATSSASRFRSLAWKTFDPRSSLWVRGTFLQGAPIAEDLAAGVSKATGSTRWNLNWTFS